jgi:uncharacterized membrane protein YgdD (TMEM256/DUF423 family)
MNKKLSGFVLLYLALGIALGAFGAHGIREIATEAKIGSFKTGVQYHLMIGLLLLWLLSIWQNMSRPERRVFFVLWVGNVMFSFSIYGLVLVNHESGIRAVLGPITPLGGSLMIFSILFLALRWIFSRK